MRLKSILTFADTEQYLPVTGRFKGRIVHGFSTDKSLIKHARAVRKRLADPLKTTIKENAVDDYS